MRRKAIAVFLLIGLGYTYPAVAIDSKSCTAIGGTVINTFNQHRCPKGKKNLGNVEGMWCPCICCADSKAPSPSLLSPKNPAIPARKP